MDPHTSRALGIAAIYQQPALFPDLTVAENIALASERGSIWRRVDWRARRRAAAQLLERIGASIDPDRIVETLSMPEQQIVEIAKAIGADARILIMDEPTASLTEREVGAAVRRHPPAAARRASGIIYISHRLDEIFAIADRVTVLRDGEAVATTRDAPASTAPELIRLMVGRELSAVFPEAARRRSGRRARASAACAIARAGSATSRSRCGAARSSASPGWSDRDAPSWPRSLFGLRPADAGEILVARPAASASSSPARAIELGHRLRAGGSPPARRHPRDVDRGEREPGQPASGRAARPDRSRPRSVAPAERTSSGCGSRPRRCRPTSGRCRAAISRRSRSPAGWRSSRAS